MRWILLVIAVGLVTGACGGVSVSPNVSVPTDVWVPSPVATSTLPPVSTLPPTTSTPVESTATTATTLPPLTLGFAGDTQFTYGLDRRDPFGDVAGLLSEPDLMFVNLETTIAEPKVGTAADKTYVFKSPADSVMLLTDAGIDGVALANNHMLDFGTPGLARTLELLDAASLPHVGAGTDAVAAYAPRFFDVEGRTVGLVAFSRIPCGWAASGANTRPEVAWTCEPFVEQTLAAVDTAAAGADVVVVMVHWGIEGDHCRQPYQRELATMWAEHGADLIVGGHPHVLQGVERIGTAWLVDSTGNFVFPSARGASALSAIFEFTVTPTGTTLEAIPVTIRGGRPRLAGDQAGTEILDELASYSFGVRFRRDETAVATSDPGICGPIPTMPRRSPRPHDRLTTQ